MFMGSLAPVGAAIDEWRAGFNRLLATFDVPADADIAPFDADGVRGLQVRARGAASDRLIVHFHSGGYVMGTSTGYRNFACRLSAITGSTVLVPDYRLAPENQYPAAVEDALTVYRWCLKRSDASNTLLSGDSAGGGLTVATLLNLREKGVAMPAGAILISPLLDLAGDGASMQSNAETDPLINRTMVVEMGKVYIGSIDPHQHPLASPLWGKHHGLPPMLAMASNSEVLRDDAVRLVDSVRKAGGQASILLPAGMIHVWTLFPFLVEATQCMEAIGAFAHERWGLSRT